MANTAIENVVVTDIKIKLPVKLKQEWLAELRNPNTAQAYEALNAELPLFPEITGFCCLGVLCNVGINKGWLPNWQSNRALLIDGHFVSVALDDKIVKILNAEALMQRVRLKNESGRYTIQSVLANANDSARWTLAQIADWIEKYL